MQLCMVFLLLGTHFTWLVQMQPSLEHKVQVSPPLGYIHWLPNWHSCLPSLNTHSSKNLFLFFSKMDAVNIQVQSLNRVWLFATQWIAAPGLPVHDQLPEFTQTHIHWISDAIQPSHPLSPILLLPPIPLSIRVFSNESTLPMRWPKYWNFSFRTSPSN